MNEPVLTHQDVKEKPAMWTRDRPGCIKFILLLFLILLLAAEIVAGEFRGFPDVERSVWLVLIIKLLLIAILLWLIRVQRELFCELTDPKGCTPEKPDWTAGKLMVEVRGTAKGSAFGSYILELFIGIPR